MLQLFELWRFLFDQTIPSDRKRSSSLLNYVSFFSLSSGPGTAKPHESALLFGCRLRDDSRRGLRVHGLVWNGGACPRTAFFVDVCRIDTPGRKRRIE